MTKPIIKTSIFQLKGIMEFFIVPTTSSYFSGEWREKFAGKEKVVLSVKVGKKRKMIPGKIKMIGHESSHISSGNDVLKFVPNNPQKANEIIQGK